MRMDDEDLLFPDQRRPPLFYKVEFQGKEEKTVSIRGGLSWPQAGIPGYFVLVGQLEEKDKDGNLRFLAFAEDQAALMKDFFEKISLVCHKWRVDALCHGDEAGEQDFSIQLSNYLETKKRKYEIIQMPSIGPMGLGLKNPWLQRSKKMDFLGQLVRKHIADKTLIFFSLTEKRTPLLIDKIRNTDFEADISGVPEIKALCFVMDDFNLSPWEPSETVKKDYY